MPSKPRPSSRRLSEAHAGIDVLRRLSEAFGRRRQQLAAAVGLTEQQWAVLEEVSTEHFMPTMFARRRESSAAAVSKILRQLKDKDLISVSVGKSDGRQRDYQLTGEGERIIAKLRAQRALAIEEVWLSLEPADLEAFTRVGSALAARLEAYATTPPTPT